MQLTPALLPARVQRALEDHRSQVMLSEWETRGDEDSPATPLTLPRRDWGDSFSSQRIRAGATVLLPSSCAPRAACLQVSLLQTLDGLADAHCLQALTAWSWSLWRARHLRCTVPVQGSRWAQMAPGKWLCEQNRWHTLQADPCADGCRGSRRWSR